MRVFFVLCMVTQHGTLLALLLLYISFFPATQQFLVQQLLFKQHTARHAWHVWQETHSQRYDCDVMQS